MDTNEFVVRLVETLAWPVITLFIVLMLRKPVVTLLKTVKKTKWQGAELEFVKGLVNAEEDAKRLNLPSAEKVKLPSFTPDMSLYEKMMAVAKISPSAAILDSWKALELATIEVAKAQGYEVFGRITGIKIIDKLVIDNKLDEGTLSLYQNLRYLRNSASHQSDFTITQDEAMRYVDLSLSLANRLQELANYKK